MNVKTLVAGLLLVPCMAFAQKDPFNFESASLPIQCGDAKPIFAKLMEIGEKVTSVLKAKNSVVVTTVHPTKKSWTVFLMNETTICLLGTGEGVVSTDVKSF